MDRSFVARFAFRHRCMTPSTSPCNPASPSQRRWKTQCEVASLRKVEIQRPSGERCPSLEGPKALVALSTLSRPQLRAPFPHRLRSAKCPGLFHASLRGSVIVLPTSRQFVPLSHCPLRWLVLQKLLANMMKEAGITSRHSRQLNEVRSHLLYNSRASGTGRVRARPCETSTKHMYDLQSIANAGCLPANMQRIPGPQGARDRPLFGASAGRNVSTTTHGLVARGSDSIIDLRRSCGGVRSGGAVRLHRQFSGRSRISLRSVLRAVLGSIARPRRTASPW